MIFENSRRICGCPGQSGDPHLEDCDFYNDDEEPTEDADRITSLLLDLPANLWIMDLGRTLIILEERDETMHSMGLEQSFLHKINAAQWRKTAGHIVRAKQSLFN